MRAAGRSSSRRSRSAGGSCATSARPAGLNCPVIGIHHSLALPAYFGAMLHLLADESPEPRPQAYAEAVSRLASVRHALRLVHSLGDGPSPDLPEEDAAIASAWDEAGDARQRSFDQRSARLV